MKNNIRILTILSITLLLAISCCPECKECELILKYEWKIPHKGFGIINMDNDRLIASEVFYKDDPNGIGSIQFVKDSGHYVIDKMTGFVIDTIFNFVPKTAENKYLWIVGQTTKQRLFFTTEISKFTITEDYNGYKIILQEWDKNIRHGNNELNNVFVFKGKKQIGKSCLPRVFDFTYDKEAVYIYSNKEIYKFTFEEIINGITNEPNF